MSKVPVNSSSVWTDTVDDNPNNASGFSPPPVKDGTEKSPAVMNQYHMTNPGLYIGYMAHYYIGDGYGQHGYTGVAKDHETFFPTGGDIHYVADFELNEGGPAVIK